MSRKERKGRYSRSSVAVSLRMVRGTYLGLLFCMPLVFIFAAGVILCFTLSLAVDLARRAGVALLVRYVR